MGNLSDFQSGKNLPSINPTSVPYFELSDRWVDIIVTCGGFLPLPFGGIVWKKSGPSEIYRPNFCSHRKSGKFAPETCTIEKRTHLKLGP